MSVFSRESGQKSKEAKARGEADAGATAQPSEHSSFAPHARKVEPLPEGQKHDQLADKEAEAEDRQEALIDESLEESFPSSDPPSAKRIT